MSRSAAAYRKYTEDEIRQANSVDILTLARSYGYEPEKAGRKAVHMKHSGGLYIFPENNRFFQWTGPDDGIKGGAIDFVMREEHLSFPEAVGKLIGQEFSPSVKQVVPYEKKEREPLVLPDKADNMKRAYWYLVSVRGISPKIVSHFMNRKMIYQEKKYGNCVFVVGGFLGFLLIYGLNGIGMNYLHWAYPMWFAFSYIIVVLIVPGIITKAAIDLLRKKTLMERLREIT